MPIEEYDDGFDSRDSFERAGADRPEDAEPVKCLNLLIRLYPAEDGEYLKTAEEVKADIEQLFDMLANGGESVGFGVEVLVLEEN